MYNHYWQFWYCNANLCLRDAKSILTFENRKIFNILQKYLSKSDIEFDNL